jgi:hypothetical protein
MAGPAAWALLAAAHGGVVRAIGQADAEGRVVLFFAYPERPAPSLATRRRDHRFPLVDRARAYWDGLDPAVTPELGALMAQLDHHAHLVRFTLSPPTAAVAIAELRPPARAAHRDHARGPSVQSRHGGVMIQPRRSLMPEYLAPACS